MNQRIAAILLATSGLCACQAAITAPPQTALMQEDLTRLKAERDAGRISYAEWAA